MKVQEAPAKPHSSKRSITIQSTEVQLYIAEWTLYTLEREDRRPGEAHPKK